MGGVLFSGTARADGITGTVSTGFGQVGVSVFGTDFFSFNGSSGQCDVPGALAGCFTVNSGTGSFAALVSTNAQQNAIQDLPAPALPLSGAVAVPGFISFGGGQINFNLTYIAPGAAQNCATAGDLSTPGLSCTIYVPYPDPFGVEISPYVLTNGPANPFSGLADTVGVSSTMYFNGYSGSFLNGYTPYVGIFSTQLSGTNILNIYTLISQGGTGTSTWSAQFSPNGPSTNEGTVPEPGSIVLAALGLIAVGYVRLKRA